MNHEAVILILGALIGASMLLIFFSVADPGPEAAAHLYLTRRDAILLVGAVDILLAGECGPQTSFHGRRLRRELQEAADAIG